MHSRGNNPLRGFTRVLTPKAFVFGIFVFIVSIPLLNQIVTNAQVPPNLPIQPSLPGQTSGTGTHFAVTDSKYLNVSLDSSQPIKGTIRSVPNMITIMIQAGPNASSSSSWLVLSGLSLQTLYYIYEDNYHNLTRIITNSSGTGIYPWRQDISKPHIIFIQTGKSTKFISDNATGGDCTQIGTWDPATKTCTLTTDVNETIEIDSDNIILDGNGHTITGSDTGSGVYLAGRTDVIIKNLNVQHFSYGINLLQSDTNTLLTNVVSDNSYGISLEISSRNIVINNTLNNNQFYGIYIGAPQFGFASSNIIDDNTFNNNHGGGIYLNGENNDGMHHRTDGTTITNNIIIGSGAYFTRGISLIEANNILVDKNIIKKVSNGIAISYNFYHSQDPDNITVKNNTLQENSSTALDLNFSTGSTIINNNFFNPVLSYESHDIFSLDKPVGGNYWNITCVDANNDGFCDSPFIIGNLNGPPNGYDYLPYTTQNGWNRFIDVTLSWSQNMDPTFDSYKIYRGTSSDAENTLVSTITDQTQTQYIDRRLAPSPTYFYKVFVFNKAGLSASSNEVSTK